MRSSEVGLSHPTFAYQVLVKVWKEILGAIHMTSSELLKWDIHELDRGRMAQSRGMEVGSKICLRTMRRTVFSIPLLQGVTG